MKRISLGFATIFLLNFGLVGCGGTASAPFNNEVFNVSATKYLYIVSGTCYGGGVAPSAGPANTIAKFDLTTGALIKVVLDYNALSPGDSPVSIAEYDNTRLLSLVENTAGRRIDIVNKDGSGYATYLTSAAALTAALRSIVMLSDFSILVSKSTAIEKFTSGKSRVMSGANPFINAPAAPCAASITLISSAVSAPSGHVVFTHAAATPNNIIGVIKPTGYAVAADCVDGQAAPATTALPTRAMFHSSGKLLVSYGSTTLANNYIYSYDFNTTTGDISSPTVAFNDAGTVVNGPSCMAEDTTNGDVFVANVTSTHNTIERFRYSSGTLTRATGQTFIPSFIYTRCVADMKVMN